MSYLFTKCKPASSTWRQIVSEQNRFLSGFFWGKMMKILYKRTLDSLTMKSLQDENNKQKWKRRLQQSFPTILNVFHTKKVTSIYAKNRQQRT